MDSEEENLGDGGRKHYKILTEEDIKKLQENDISTVSSVLSVSRGVACSLLCQNNWCPLSDSLYDKWFAAADNDDGETNPVPAEQGSSKKLCNICYSKTRQRRMASAACGHPFCTRCWKTYIKTAVRDGAACLSLRCPDPGCRAAVTFDMVESLASKSIINKYDRYLLRSYVELSRSRKWCPGAGCDRAVEFEGGGSDVVCDCSHKFCWRCTEECHRPVACELVADWKNTNKSEAENTKWILAFTKPCPKCKCPIEKNKGCNHMTCPCKFQFCWICGGRWKGHGGQYFTCNKYKEGEDKDEDKRDSAKISLERYTHYYERWASNDRSRKIAMEDLKRAEGRCEGRMKLVVQAWEQVVECRRVLKWSYVYGYYLSEEEDSKRSCFESLQGQAEEALERLHGCVEEVRDESVYVDGEKFENFRNNLLLLTSVTGNHFEKLVEGLENNLVEVVSSKRKGSGSSIEKKKTKKRRRR